ncbi:VHS-domain-containing protein [Lentinus tigrinus ALCF2SS1-7]|uniref:VHS-domain-containing protein n=1 Tax=Lentinus tigrinus ALCF2SS1-6 TaxID=1328759 RepID=A0A5C2SQZ7_9APHY|nr:VHS-domain-containing protein [Lentinus tigrinus ALCF2SS1-6]RPD79042.1 VHS-domain-containing protein [Lentinus tigrinus ALCF2SS1-7]
MLSASSPSWLSNVSQVEVLITRACNPTMGEPNYALHLEVAEYINQKKANTPREAAMTIARLVNHRNPHIAMLALALLETLVQSCGYAFQLQIATKEFLNELVRRFPERPPPFPGPVMQKILDLINNWKEGICVESRWKDDFSNIRDMHRLLTFKGYRFRDVPRQSAGSSASNIKSADELEAEDREAQEAKLQELIRRGTPRDLAAAQELMKTLAGANPDAKPDYRTQALTELNKLESKVILLNEILDNADTTKGEKFVQGDVYDQVASILRDARPKIQKWISNAETDDPESLDTYLQINDQINTVLNRYEAYKKGDYTVAANPIPPELSNGAGPSGSQSVSLIDFDDAPAQSAVPAGGAGGIDELASLFGPSAPVQSASIPATSPAPAPNIMGNLSSLYAQSANTAMGAGMGFGGMGMSTQPQQAQTPPIYHTPTPMMGMGMGGQPPRAGTVSPSSGAPLGSIRLGTPSTPSHPPPQPQSPGYFGQPMQPMQPQHQQQQFQPTHAQTQPQAQPAAGQQGKDPFADLVGLF